MSKTLRLTIVLCIFTMGSIFADIFGTGDNQFEIDFVTVGNAGNAADGTGYGAVDYDYRIGTYEVTAGQYCQFLNAVAQNDHFALYNKYMSDSSYGCRIARNGSPGNYSYSISSDRENRPVNFVSWYDAARFCNYLTSGNTEEGVYDTTTWSMNHSEAQAAFGIIYFIPSEDEWYKAAYHKNDGITGNYWLYPTQSNEEPSNDITDPDGGNNANFYQDGFAIGAPYWLTEVGEFENSCSAYGTFDQGGNVWEFNETKFGSNRGGTAGGYSYYLASTGRYDFHGPDEEGSSMGIRIASVAIEPPIIVSVDIKPGNCPNPLNVKSNGVLSVAILGSEVFDVSEIDIDSVEFLGVRPLRSNIEDVAAPVIEEALPENCLCTTEGLDGYPDMILKYDTPEIIKTIGEVEDGDYVILTLTGSLKDGTPIEGTDCVMIIKKGKY